jgi:hypothetical protein
MEKTKTLHSAGNQTPAVQPTARGYTDCQLLLVFKGYNEKYSELLQFSSSVA